MQYVTKFKLYTFFKTYSTKICQIYLIYDIFRDKKLESAEEDEELLSLSPQPSLVSTVTHGANNNRNSLRKQVIFHFKRIIEERKLMCECVRFG